MRRDSKRMRAKTNCCFFHGTKALSEERQNEKRVNRDRPGPGNTIIPTQGKRRVKKEEKIEVGSV